MPDLLLVDNDELYLNALRRHVQLRLPRFRVVKTILNPVGSTLDDGPLISYLRNHDQYTPEEPLFILLDVHFGNIPEERELGLTIARFIDESEFAGTTRIIAATGKDGQFLFDDLNAAGVDQVVRKENITRTLGDALRNAEHNRSYADDLVFSQEQSVTDDETQCIQIARDIAKGYTNNFLRRQDGGNYGLSVAVQKMKFRKAHIDDLTEAEIPGLRHPNHAKDWNDVWFLLHHLRERDRAVVDYVEKMCGLKIAYPT